MRIRPSSYLVSVGLVLALVAACSQDDANANPSACPPFQPVGECDPNVDSEICAYPGTPCGQRLECRPDDPSFSDVHTWGYVPPLDGTSCASPGETCSYSYWTGGFHDEYEAGTIVCTDDGYQIASAWPVCCGQRCPETLPQPGTPCERGGRSQGCGYAVETTCGVKMATIACGDDGYEITIPDC